MERLNARRKQDYCEAKGRSRQLLGARILDPLVEVTEADAQQQQNRVNYVVPAHGHALTVSCSDSI